MTQPALGPDLQEHAALTRPRGTVDSRQAAYFRRSYAAVDGLWFMKVEERLGFDAALELDEQVWKVLPKIQARLLKELLGADCGLAALAQCLGTRLTWEGHTHDCSLSADERRLEIRVSECPWHDVMLKTGREHLSGQVGERICGQEYAVWADEFGPGITFSLEDLLCQGSPTCRLIFLSSQEAADSQAEDTTHGRGQADARADTISEADDRAGL